MCACASNVLSLSARVQQPVVRRKRKTNIKTRIHILFKKLNSFFDNEEHFNTMYSILKQESLVSLRLCQFICTTMARNGLITKDLAGNEVPLEEVHRSQQDSQGKVLFDPFCRNPKSRFLFTKFNRTVDTNIAQLRFMRFAITYGVISYALANFRHVEDLMSAATAARKNKRKNMTATARQRTKKKKLFTPHTPKPVAGEITVHMDSMCSPKRTKKSLSPTRKLKYTHVHINSVRLTFSPSVKMKTACTSM